MEKNPKPEFINQNWISTEDDLDTKQSQIPKKPVKAAFDVIHPVIEEELTKQKLELEAVKSSIEKTQGERLEKFKLLFYGTSIAALLFFSLKRWFPLLRMPFF